MTFDSSNTSVFLNSRWNRNRIGFLLRLGGEKVEDYGQAIELNMTRGVWLGEKVERGKGSIPYPALPISTYLFLGRTKAKACSFSRIPYPLY
jgi:hypothetical protein